LHFSLFSQVVLLDYFTLAKKTFLLIFITKYPSDYLVPLPTVKNAAFFSFFTEYILQILALISVSILARLLTPTEFGIYSIALTVIFLLQNITSFGVGQYIIREKVVTYENLKSAVGFNYLTAWSLGIFVYFSSSVVANFYNEPGISEIFKVLSLYFAMTPLGGVTEAFLRRKLDFKSLSKIFIYSKLVVTPFTIFLAFSGFGYMSMAWGLVLEKLLFVLLLNAYRPDSVPLYPSFRGLKPIFTFGMKISFVSFSKQTRKSLPELFIAKIMSVEINGYYSRAFGAVQIFNRLFSNAIMKVILPIFAKENRENSGKSEKSYIKTLSIFTVFSIPFFSQLFLLSDPIILILYGEQWLRSIPILQVLCVWGSISSLYTFSNQYFISKSKENLLVTQEIVILPISFLLVMLSSEYGVQYIAGSLVLVGVVELIYVTYILHKYIYVSYVDLLMGTYKSLIVAAISSVIPLYFYVISEIKTDYYFETFFISIAGALLGWLIGIIVTNHLLYIEFKKFIVNRIDNIRW
jgi:O-antigen/teichoic acid export membrane protein